MKRFSCFLRYFRTLEVLANLLQELFGFWIRLPTVARELLLDLPPLDDADGRSRRPEVLAAVQGIPEPSQEGPRFAHLDQTWGRSNQKPSTMVSVSDGPFRLFHRESGAPPELYDRSTDPYEQIDLASDRPELLERMTELADEYLAQPPAAWSGGADVEIDPQEPLHLLAHVTE